MTTTQKQDLQCLIRDHMQLLVQSYVITGHDSSKGDMFLDTKALILELFDLVDMSNPSADVLNLVDNVKSFMNDNPTAIAKISPDYETQAVGLDDSHVDGISKQSLVSKEVADLMDKFALVFKPELYPTQTINRRPFTNAEDELLAHGLKKFGTNWQKICANMLPCKSEDDSHVAGISKQSLVSKEVADLMDKFALVFKPELYPKQTINRRPFTNAEDELLALGLKKFGTNWQKIRANMLPCKSESEIKNRASARGADE